MPEQQTETTATADKAPAPACAESLDAARKAVEAGRPKDFAENHLIMVERDFWQNKKGWGGPPVPAGHPDADRQWKRIEELFTPRDAVGEAAKHRTDALLKFEAQSGMEHVRGVTDEQPETPAEKMLRTEANSSLTGWWDLAGIHREARKAEHATAWAGDGEEGFAFLRWWVPAHHLIPGEEGAPPRLEAVDVADALRKFQVAAVLPDAAARVVDKETGREVFVLLDGAGDDQVAEVFYVDGEDTVFLRIPKDAKDRTEVRMPLGGLLPIAMVRGRKLIDEAVRKQQRTLNFINTSVGRNVETCAWPERYTIDVQPSGTWRVVPEGKSPTPGRLTRDGEGGRLEELVPQSRTVGSATITELQSVEYNAGREKGTVRAAGQVIRFDPVDPILNTRASDWARYVVLDSCGQGHMVTNEDASPSGKSRREARAEFEADVQNARHSLEAALRTLIQSAFAAAEHFANTPGRYTGTMRASVVLHVDTGPASAEEIRIDAELVEKGLLDHESLLARANVEDIEGVLNRIKSNPQVRATFVGKLVVSLAQMVAALPEADPVELAVMVGWDEATARKHLGAVADARAQKAAETARIREAMERTRADVEPVVTG